MFAQDGGEYGIRLGTYLDDVGTGVDLNFIMLIITVNALRKVTGRELFAGDYYAFTVR